MRGGSSVHASIYAIIYYAIIYPILAAACAAVGLHGARAPQDPPAAALGHAALAADLAMARAQVYFGAELETRGSAPRLPTYLDEAVGLDPSARERYLRGAAMLVYSGPVLTTDGVLAADRLLARGTRALPGDWELWFQIGFDHLYELPRLADAGDPRRAGWRRDGVAAMARAARLDGAPPWLGDLAAAELVREAR